MGLPPPVVPPTAPPAVPPTAPSSFSATSASAPTSSLPAADASRLPRLEWAHDKLSPHDFLLSCTTLWLDHSRVPEATRVRHVLRTIISAGEVWAVDFSGKNPTTTWENFCAAFTEHYNRPSTLQVEYHALNAIQLRLRGGDAYEAQFDNYVARLRASSQREEMQRVLLDHWVEPHSAWSASLQAFRLVAQPLFEYTIQVRSMCPARSTTTFGRRSGGAPTFERRRGPSTSSGPNSNFSNRRQGNGNGNGGNGNFRQGGSRPWQREAQANFMDAMSAAGDAPVDEST